MDSCLPHPPAPGLSFSTPWGILLPIRSYLTIFMEPGLYSFSFTPMTNMGASGDGAQMTTRWAPASMWGWRSSRVLGGASSATPPRQPRASPPNLP